MAHKPQEPDLPNFFDPKDHRSPVVVARQQQLFEALARVTPEVLMDLRDRLLPVYHEALELPGCDPIDHSLSDVMEWADRHHLLPLDNWWVPVRALHCLHCWASDEQSADRLEIPQIPNFPAQLEGFNRRAAKFDFSAEGWWFEFESWKEFEKRVQNEFRRRLKSYRATAEDALREGGYLPAVRKRARSTDSTEIHYEWLALRVCRRATYAQIADRYSRTDGIAVSDDAVRSAIRQTAESVRLLLRNRR